MGKSDNGAFDPPSVEIYLSPLSRYQIQDPERGGELYVTVSDPCKSRPASFARIGVILGRSQLAEKCPDLSKTRAELRDEEVEKNLIGFVQK